MNPKDIENPIAKADFKHQLKQEDVESLLTDKEEKELEYLRELQSDNTRYLSKEEYDRIKELASKNFI